MRVDDFDQEQEKDPSLLVHLNKEECKAFDLAQQGSHFIPIETSFSERMKALGFPIENDLIRDYRPLASVIKNPGFQKSLRTVLENIDQEGQMSPSLEPYYQEAHHQEHFDNLSEHDPIVKDLMKAGEGGDTEIVYMPLSVCNFLDTIKGGEPKTNPKTGFPEYFWEDFLPMVFSTAVSLWGADEGMNQMERGRNEEIAAWERENARERAEREERRRKSGFYNSLDELPDEFKRGGSLNSQRKESHKKFFSGYFKKNSPLKEDLVDQSEFYKGSGKGQQDNLKKKLPINGYIVNATAVAHLGDGNSDAGRKVIQKYENKLKRTYKGPRIKKKLKTTPGLTSSKEYQLSPLTVTLIGKGSNQRGSHKLDQGIARLMQQKSQNGSKLPPKAHSFETYLS